jgi:predicted pyridoxine 5'-phosphate oxidase superfamily flavin-nucleotide-binding protein
MPTTAELTARSIVDADLYLVLATADGTGRPWSSPVYFAHDRYAGFFWVADSNSILAKDGRPDRRIPAHLA